MNIEDLKKVGATGRLPPNVKEIQTTFVFDRDVKRQARCAYTSKKGDKARDVLRCAGIRPEFLNIYLKYVGKSVNDIVMDDKMVSKPTKAFCKAGLSFPSPEGERWTSLVNSRQDHNTAGMLSAGYYMLS